MNRSDTDNSIMRDEKLERLLREFFRSEMPAPLREDSPLSLASDAASRPPSRRRSKAAAVVVAACAVLSLSVFMPRGADRSSIPPVGAGSRVSGHRAEGVDPLSPREREPAVLVDERVEPLRRDVVETDSGPVERRIHQRTTTVTVDDPETGTRLQWGIPELEIELVPLDDSKLPQPKPPLKKPAKPNARDSHSPGKSTSGTSESGR